MNEQTRHSLLVQRFELISLVGEGGMGSVYRGLDWDTGQVVAIKLLRADQRQPSDIDRFVREAKLLSTLRHPGIVGYIDHGFSSDGQPFLVMEWLDGEDLHSRLQRGCLTVPETLTLLTKTAEALGFAHAAGVIHRDLKPSNLFLRAGRIENLAVLDFGIARHAAVSRAMTRTGAVLGTPDYMAPEQARGEREVGPAADLFSLGCVLYECLCGQPPFAAAHIAATLAKILFAEPPALRLRVSGLPAGVDALIQSLLAKDPKQRPDNLLATLHDSELRLTLEYARTLREDVTIPERLADAEQRLLSVVVVTPRGGALPDATLAADVVLGQQHDLLLLRQSLQGLDARLEELADGSLVGTILPISGDATEQVTRAVQCAQLLRERFAEADVVMATGRGISGAALPIGEAIDRAGRLLRQELAGGRDSASGEILLDEVSASLLQGRFALEARGSLFALRGENIAADPSRPLLGRPTPCVGREGELGLLEGTLSSCIDESSPRAILVTAAPGLGKSRLRHEFLRRVRQRHPEAEVWLGQCDPLSSGTSYGPLSRILRAICHIQEGAPLEEKRARLRERLSQHIEKAAAAHVCELLGELCGVPFPAEHNLKLRAARQDPRLMADLVLQALLGLLRGECSRAPLVLVLEDLQWCDSLTVKVLGAALTQLLDAPLCVLALARPELHATFPHLWRGLVQVIPLRPLSRKAAERLVQQFLGQAASPTLQSRIVEQADGNPLWLEELIRSAASGAAGEAPLGILAMLQARIGQLPAHLRQLLRAASVFGESACLGGVAALLQRREDGELAAQVKGLEEREILLTSASSRYAGQTELRFRHSLMRDAAYSLLMEEDRALGHRLACLFLEEQGETEAALLAEHARRGNDLPRAALHYSAAAEGALAGNDVISALKHAQAGLSCAPTGEVLGLLRTIEAMASLWGSDLLTARRAGLEALSLLSVGSRRWFQAMLAMWMTTTYLGEAELFRALREQVRSVVPAPDAVRAYIESVSFLIVMSSLVGDGDESRFFLANLERETAPYIDEDLAVRGWVRYAQGVYCHWIEGNLWRKALLSQESLLAAEGIGDRRLRCLALTSRGLAEQGLGLFARGEMTFREALRIVNELQGEKYLVGSTAAFFASGLIDRGDEAALSEALSLSQLAIASVTETSASAGLAHTNLARIHSRSGHLDLAEQHAQQGERVLRVEPAVYPLACAALARVQLQRGAVAAAEQTVARGMQSLAQTGSCGTDLDLLCCATELADAKGDREPLIAALRRCVGRLSELVQNIGDRATRYTYLHGIPQHAAVLRKLIAALGHDAALALLPEPAAWVTSAAEAALLPSIVRSSD